MDTLHKGDNDEIIIIFPPEIPKKTAFLVDLKPRTQGSIG